MKRYEICVLTGGKKCHVRPAAGLILFFSGTNVGVVSFSSSAKTEIPFTSPQNVDKIKSSVWKIYYRSGSTRLDLGLNKTREEFVSARGEMRTNMPDVLLAITDGQSDKGENLFMSLGLKKVIKHRAQINFHLVSNLLYCLRRL